MPDIVVKDLTVLVRDLDTLVEAFKAATKLQNQYKEQWGQLNANLSMGDFAHNWKVNRGKIADSMKKFRERVEGAAEGWADGESQLAASLDEES